MHWQKLWPEALGFVFGRMSACAHTHVHTNTAEQRHVIEIIRGNTWRQSECMHKSVCVFVNA